MRQNFLPILENYGVDLVLTGHSHSYERSRFIDGHYGLSSTYNSSFAINGGSGRVDGTGAYTKTASMPHSGAVYSVVGASGQVSGGTLNHPAMFLSLNELGSMVIDVSGQTMDIKYLNNNGTVRDYFTISKNTTPTLPAAPGSLTATAASTSTINLSWADNSNNETGFDIERSSDNINWAALATVGSNVQAYSNTGLAASTTYFYRVRARNGTGNSAYSECGQRQNARHRQHDGHGGPARRLERLRLSTQDTYVASGASGSNFGSSTAVLADGADGSNGELASLLKWSVTGIPSTATVMSVRVQLRTFNLSTGTYRLYARNAAWAESTATWANANIIKQSGYGNRQLLTEFQHAVHDHAQCGRHRHGARLVERLARQSWPDHSLHQRRRHRLPFQRIWHALPAPDAEHHVSELIASGSYQCGGSRLPPFFC
ncbi:DNRLRE domain-containing protein [Massilia sp. B-10]|nr:DNRLRE domain-containing protein [Massilia sp. B-10]